jgi:glycerate kinase
MKKEVEIMDPLRRPTKASYLMDYETRTAFVEVANSAGLQMLSAQTGERDPFKASSIGIG